MIITDPSDHPKRHRHFYFLADAVVNKIHTYIDGQPQELTARYEPKYTDQNRKNTLKKKAWTRS